MTTVTTLLAGALVAFTVCLPPGPILVETIRRGLHGGFCPALWVQLGSIVGDLGWCAAALFGLAPLVAVPWVRLPLGGLGLAVLLWLGGQGVREALTLRPPLPSVPDGRGGVAGTGSEAFRSGLAISFANPLAIGFWVGLGGVMAAAGIAGKSAAQTAVFVGGYLAGLLAWALCVSLCFRRFEKWLQPGGRMARAITGSCGLCLTGLGIGLGWQVIGGWIG